MAIELKLSEGDYKKIRERWDKEDGLLNTRTGIFLTSNTILFAASRFQEVDDFYFQLCIAIVGIILSFMWLVVSLRTAKFLHYYGYLCGKILPKNNYATVIFSIKEIINELKQIENNKKPNKNKKEQKNKNFFIELVKSLKKFYPTKIISLYLPFFIIICWIAFGFYLSIINGKIIFNFQNLIIFDSILFALFIIANIIYLLNKYSLRLTLDKIVSINEINKKI